MIANAPAQVAGFRYFNVYGPREQQHDFVFVDDVVAVNLWFLQTPQAHGIFNLGSGRAQAFNDVATASVNSARELAGEASLPLAELVERGFLQYIDFPQALVGKCQCHTQADLTALRKIGCDHQFADVATGVRRYVQWLHAQTEPKGGAQP